MKTAKQIKEEARERFDEEGKAPYWFFLPYEQEVATDMLEECWEWIDQLIDTTIKQTLEGVRVEEKIIPSKQEAVKIIGKGDDVYGSEIFKMFGFNEAVKQQNKLAKEIYENS